MAKTNANYRRDKKKYGAKDFEACYSCGNCTAVCELTDKNANFPRIYIRHGVLGQTNDILNSKDLWMCYACGECSLNCPRQAAPGDYMAALRRYAIASYEPTKITKLIFKNNFISLFITLILAVVLGFFLLTIKPEYELSRWLFKWIPYDAIHNIGLVIIILTSFSMIWGIFILSKRIAGSIPKNDKKKVSIIETIKKVSNELGSMKRYRNCDNEEESYWKNKPEYVKPWFVHWTIMWGFLGLLFATILDFIFKDPDSTIWWPSRILGTVAGLLMMYGSTLAIIYRTKKITRSYQNTMLADWMLLVFLWIAGLTGFWLEISVGFVLNNLISQFIFLLHTIVSMELVLLFAFSKFAHAIYRPVALWFYFRNNN